MRMPRGSDAARWLFTAILVLLSPGLLISFLAQASSFLGLRVTGLVPDIFDFLMSIDTFSTQLAFAFLVGASLGLVLAFEVEKIPKLGTAAWYVHLVSHELVHATLAKACGYKISEIKLTRHGGYVSYYKPNRHGNFLISLGPYILPPIPIILLLASALVKGRLQVGIILLLGAAFTSHVVGTAREILDQYDVRQSGLSFSLVFVFLVNLILGVAVMRVAAPGRVSLVRFFLDAAALDGRYLSLVFESIVRLIS